MATITFGARLTGVIETREGINKDGRDKRDGRKRRLITENLITILI